MPLNLTAVRASAPISVFTRRVLPLTKVVAANVPAVVPGSRPTSTSIALKPPPPSARPIVQAGQQPPAFLPSPAPVGTAMLAGDDEIYPERDEPAPTPVPQPAKYVAPVQPLSDSNVVAATPLSAPTWMWIAGFGAAFLLAGGVGYGAYRVANERWGKGRRR